jgi:hypothetical protein
MVLRFRQDHKITWVASLVSYARCRSGQTFAVLGVTVRDRIQMEKGGGGGGETSRVLVPVA